MSKTFFQHVWQPFWRLVRKEGRILGQAEEMGSVVQHCTLGI
ncbi:MAG: hypothetical protein WCW33_02470 [Candidatus Babeliales bacterium]